MTRPSGRASGRRLAGLALAGLALWGCAPSLATPTRAAFASQAPSAAAPPSVATSPSDGPSPAGASAGSSVLLDETLLRILPPDIDGAPVTAEPDSFAEAASDPDFARNVESAAFAVVVDGGDLASGVIANLRPGLFSDSLFRDWRDTYNVGACDQAGGLEGNAQADLGGRTVYIATCKGGLHVYHAYLPERGVIVSLFSLGDRRFGERLISDLRP